MAKTTINVGELDASYEKYRTFVDIIFTAWKLDLKKWEEEAEKNWSDVKKIYGIQDDLSLKQLLQEMINYRGDLNPSPLKRTEAIYDLGRDIWENKKFIENQNLEGGRKYGVEMENVTLQALKEGSGKIVEKIAENLIIKKVRGKDEIDLEIPTNLSSDIGDILQQNLTDIMKQRKRQGKKIRGSRFSWDAYIVPQSIAKESKYGVDHTFVFDLVFIREDNWGRLDQKEIIPSIQVEEKNVNVDNLPSYLITNFKSISQWKWKYEKVPYFIYEGKILSAIEMLNKVQDRVETREVFNQFYIRKGGK